MRRSERPYASRPTCRAWLIPVGLAAILPGCGGLPRQVASPPARPAPIAPDTPVDADPTAKVLLDLHNRRRAEHDLPPLTLDPKLAAAASGHASEMIELGKIGHEGADGSTPADRVERQGYRYVKVGENVAAGQESAEEVMAGWMDSPGHRRNILGDFEQMGAARAEDAEGQPYWCVVFATPLPQLDPDRASSELIGLINARRAEQSLPPIEPDEALMGVARDRARAMADAGSLDPPGETLAEAVARAGIGYRRLASGSASGQPKPADVIDTFSRDATQGRDLLGDFDRIGVGYATSGDGRPYWSVLYLKRPPG